MSSFFTISALFFILLTLWISIKSWKTKQSWFSVAWYERKATTTRIVLSLVLPLAVIRWSLVKALGLDSWETTLSLLAFYISWILFTIICGDKLTKGAYGTWTAHLGRFYSKKLQLIAAVLLAIAWIPSFLLPSLSPIESGAVIFCALLLALPSSQSAIRGTWMMYGALGAVLGILIAWLQSNLGDINFTLQPLSFTGDFLTPLVLAVLPWIDVPMIHRLNASTYPEIAKRSLWITLCLSFVVDISYWIFIHATTTFPPFITEALIILPLVFLVVTLAYIWQSIASLIVRDVHLKESLQANDGAVGYFRLYILLCVLVTYALSLTDLFPTLLLILGASILPAWFFMWIATKKLAASAGLLSFIIGTCAGIAWWFLGITNGTLNQPAFVWNILPFYPALAAAIISFFFQNLYVRRAIFGWKF